ncbi:MAG TPA: aminopeptidase P N-terminal domain-containing protein [Cytophagaceae bacterium]|jgi:Xaa-Pro aminopeptidase|nr:aminopeptidase P N-terminal domain-containing protein [Cytophagaceae bacterium]
MKYLPIGKELFIENRRKFVKELKPGSIAIFNSNDIMPTNADGTMPFRQNNDLFYLSGIDQEETILILFPDSKNSNQREMLFVKETNEHIAIWEGQKLTKKQAMEASGIQNIQWTKQFDHLLEQIIPESEYIYLNSNEHSRAAKLVQTRDDRFSKHLREQFPLSKYERSAPIMQALRTIKSAKEIELISKACEITEKAFRRILSFVKPGITEYEIEAEFIHEFLRSRSRGPAYQPIIASGFDSCILHYVENHKTCIAGDIILMDVAAEYANYASDMTRVIPVNGKFTKRQKDVYNAVLRIMREATTMLVPGNTLTEYNKEVNKITESELVGLGLLNKTQLKNQDPENPLLRKYFMHGASHALGLDVHDVYDKYNIFKEGMVFTCEPGIYIREESLGIRLENNILVSSNGPIDLMKNIPVEAEEIEYLMDSKK